MENLYQGEKDWVKAEMCQKQGWECMLQVKEAASTQF